MQYFLIMPVLTVVLLPSPGLAACNVCHSKDPKIVRMHSAQGFKDCFVCHGPSAKPTDRNERSSDPRCLTCHKK